MSAVRTAKHPRTHRHEYPNISSLGRALAKKFESKPSRRYISACSITTIASVPRKWLTCTNN
ncbi:hypothetical protein PILCRDRAFT_248019 [Piloderma croceum F 1598]|uniref:Uncharacterized protein n=1 Tax=Piloderma croceum (strain F 1598) TaxID=765440 RepID=A0A0C3FUR7_PILCF|nr:hypothetical protein PILCRDRAFT_248019 [Piloderma croceum F 1598]